MAVNADALVLAKEINKKLKGDIVVVAGDVKHDLIPRMPTGSLTLDVILGGGWPANQWCEIIGHASHGKTFVALKTIAANQQRDPEFTTVWVAAEQWVPEWAEKCGVDLDRVLLVETNIMEEAYQAVITFAESRAIDAIVIDSLPALVPSLEDEKEAGESTVGKGALLTNQFFRKVGKAMKRSLTEEERPVLGLMINQWRQKIGAYGDDRTTPGGVGKDYAYFVRLEVARKDWLTHDGKDKGRKVGQQIRCKTIKNKSAPSQDIAQFDMYFDDTKFFRAGELDRAKEIAALAVLNDIVEQRGSWLYYGENKWQGKDAFLASLREEIDLAEEITAKVMEVLR